MSARISITVKVPEVVLRTEFIRVSILQQMQRKTAPDLQRLFKQTVQGWKDPPVFLQKFTNSPSEVSTTVWPGQNTKGGKIYALVNAGSPRHPIFPRRRGGMLRFYAGYRPSTRPRVLRSGPNARFGDYVGSYGVNHPGFEAREFDSTIAEQYEETFVEDMQDAIHVATVRN